ncbi:hypothetical protein [Hydrogenophaga sp.]|uniref:hypothetical protein n=1 Tax=Hydrogenophaga sp. TaxID=1904254 RepID=UPI00271B7D75|nr:hypothetical protein [Hydrogenophaga sp.]MDO8906568.1 hypothetical protein [Hydrogenophaga sp.]
MNQSLEALMSSVCRALQEDILPELSSDHARSQLAGVLDVLDKVESMVVWSPDVVREQVDLIESCLSKAVVFIAASGHSAPSGIAADEPVNPATQTALLAALADAEYRFARFTDWLFSPPERLPGPLSVELHELLRTTLRNTLKAQRRLVPSADFSSMTAPRPQAGAKGGTP